MKDFAAFIITALMVIGFATAFPSVFQQLTDGAMALWLIIQDRITQ